MKQTMIFSEKSTEKKKKTQIVILNG